MKSHHQHLSAFPTVSKLLPKGPITLFTHIYTSVNVSGGILISPISPKLKDLSGINWLIHFSYVFEVSGLGLEGHGYLVIV